MCMMMVVQVIGRLRDQRTGDSVNIDSLSMDSPNRKV